MITWNQLNHHRFLVPILRKGAELVAKSLNLLVIASLLLTPISPLLARPAAAFPAIDDTAIPAGTALYRTTVTLTQPNDRDRLAELGVTVLTEQPTTALVLADEAQLETLTRQHFELRHTDKVSALLEGHNIAAASPSLQVELTNLPSIDNDGDGLTDTEEQWWCTDPNNPNSDNDANGYTDGQEVEALLDFTLPRTTRWNYGPPFGPPAAWPDFNGQDGNPNTPACNDGDYDTIPDMAEAYVVGTRVGTQDSENTDGDKFDDGQEFFGLTYCPGGSASCGYGNYPRTQDYSFITSAMPSWIRPPGDSPFVAAYPVIEFEMDPTSIRVVAKEVKTIERTITQGEEISTGFAETKGNSTTVGTIDTNTHSTWQEHSSTEGGIEPAGLLTTQSSPSAFSLPPDLPVLQTQGVVTPTQPTQPLSDLDKNAIEQAALVQIRQERGVVSLDQGPFQVEDIEGDGNWAILNLTSYPLTIDPDAHLVVPEIVLAVAQKGDQGIWSVALEGSEEYQQSVPLVPDTILSDESKNILLSSSNEAGLSIQDTTYSIPGLPWLVNTSWRFTSGPSLSHPNAFDFATPSYSSEPIYSADYGVVVKSNETCMAIRRGGDGLVLWYQHINSNDVANFRFGQSIPFGMRLGMTTTGAGCGCNNDDKCKITGHHVHFFLGPPQVADKPASWTEISPEGSSLNGWVVNGTNLTKGGLTRQPNGTDKIAYDINANPRACTEPQISSYNTVNNTLNSQQTDPS